MKAGSLLSGTAVYLFSNIANAAIPFALLPILTRYLTPAQYGEVAMFQTLLGAVGAFVGTGIISASARKYYDGVERSEELRIFIAGCLKILAVSTAAALLAVLLFADALSAALSLGKNWLVWSVLVASLNIVFQLRLSQWQVEQRPIAYGLLQVSQSAANMLLSLLLVVVMALGSDGRIAAQIVVSVAFAGLAALLLHRDGLLSMKSKRESVGEALAFGVPLIPHEAGNYVLGFADRIVITALIGLHQTGIYTVSVQIASGLGLVLVSIQNAYVPWLFERLKQDVPSDKKHIVKQTYRWFAALLAIAAAAFAVGPWMVRLLAGDGYAEAGQVLGLLVLGQAFNGMYLMVTGYVFYGRRTGLLSVSTIATAVLNVTLMIYLIPAFGLRGAAAAYALTMSIRFAATWFIANRSHPMPWFH